MILKEMIIESVFAVIRLMRISGIKNNEVIKMTDPNDMSNSDNNINGSDFELMETAVNNYNGTPDVVYIRINGVKTVQYISYAKYQQMLTRWGAIIKSQSIAINVGTPVTPAEPVTPATPVTPSFIQGIFINPNDTPNPDYTQLKQAGITEAYYYMDVAHTNPELTTIYNAMVAAGLKPFGWVYETDNNDTVTLVKQLVSCGFNIILDDEGTAIAQTESAVDTYLANVRAACAGKTFTAITKPDALGFDSSAAYGQVYSAMIKYCDYIMPMAYIGTTSDGGYNATVAQLTAGVQSMAKEAPGKLVVALETYYNGVARTASDMLTQINAVKPYCQGFALFRYGLVNFGSITTSTPTPTTSVVGPIQAAIQDALGSPFTTFTEYFNLVKKYCKYSGYFNAKYDLAQEIANMKQARLTPADAVLDADNCVDYSRVSHALATEMKYTVRFVGIYCTVDQINHAYIELQGFEFDNTWTAADLAEATSDGTDIGSHWCDGTITYNPSWIPSEDTQTP